MVRPTDFIVWLRDVDREDIRYVGEKSANLGEMMQEGLPVPPGFAITTHAYTQFIKHSKLDISILHLLNTINYNDPNSVKQVSGHIQRLINHAPIPDEISSQIFSFYGKLERGKDDPLVAVRSSLPSDSSQLNSQFESVLNVKGDAALVNMIRQVWASHFEAKDIIFRQQRNLPHTKVKIAILVQKMIESESSGIMFTIDPYKNDKNTIIIEAIYGLGEYAVENNITPDHYTVDKKSMQISSKYSTVQENMLVKARALNKIVSVPRSLKNKQKISDDDILQLAQYAKKLEKHYYFPQDCEWAKEKGQIYIVQTKQLTNITLTTTQDKATKILTPSQLPQTPFLIGDPIHAGIGTGPVRILKDTKEVQNIRKGDVVVVKSLLPTYAPAIRKAAAVIVESDIKKSYRHQYAGGTPIVADVPNALRTVRNSMTVTVNGRTGTITRGGMSSNTQFKISESLGPEIKTPLYVNVTDPSLPEELALFSVDGIGLLDAGKIISDYGVHPKRLLRDKKSGEFVNTLAVTVEKICAAMYPRPVFYKFSDLKTVEYKQLVGGKEYEPDEPNPLIGYRGALRHVHDPKVFELELKAIQKVREKKKLNNLNVVIPFVRTVRELELIKKRVWAAGLRRSSTFKLYIMCETPANALLIDDYLRAGIDGVIIGLDNLATLTLGFDHENDEVAHEFDERSAAILWTLEHIITSCNKKKVPVSVCGQALSYYSDLIEKLIEWGISSITVSPNTIDSVREFVFRAESKNTRK